MGDAQIDTQALQSAANKPPAERPANMKETFSVLPTKEVVAIGVSRAGAGREAQITLWVWVDKGKRWAAAEDEYGPEVAKKLRDGMELYEETLRKDPKEAFRMRQRADNTVDGTPDPQGGGAAETAAAPPQGAAPGISEPDATPANLLTQPEMA